MKNKCKLYVVLHTFDVGGAERVLIELANNLFLRNIQVAIIVMQDVGPLREEVSPSVEVINLRSSRMMLAIWRLSRILIKSNSIVLSSTYSTGIIALCAKILCWLKPVVVLGAHNSILYKFSHPDNKKDKFFLKPLSHLLFPLASAVVPVSFSLRQELRSIFRINSRKIHPIYNPVYTPRITELSAERCDHPWLREDRDFHVIVSAGRFVEQKGFSVLVTALSIVNKTMPVRLILLGSGPLKRDYVALSQSLNISALIDYPGMVTNPYKYYSKADLFVLSSLWEGLPTVLIEALSCNCKIVSTDCPHGPSEILEGGKHGLLCNPNSPEDLADKISIQLNSECEQSSLSSTLVNRAKTFNTETSLNKYIDLFESLAPKRF